MYIYVSTKDNSRRFFFGFYDSFEEMDKDVHDYIDSLNESYEISYAEDIPEPLMNCYSLSEECYDYAKHYLDSDSEEREIAYAYVMIFEDWDEGDCEDRYVGYFTDYEELGRHGADGFLEHQGLEQFFDFEGYGQYLDLYFYCSYNDYYFV